MNWAINFFTLNTNAKDFSTMYGSESSGQYGHVYEYEHTYYVSKLNR